MKAVERPGRVHIGPFQFDVTWSTSETKVAADSHPAMGVSDVRTAHIWICEDLHQSIEREALLHELLHMVIRTFGVGLELDEETEERTVCALTPALLGILRDNPDLIRYLTS